MLLNVKIEERRSSAKNSLLQSRFDDSLKRLEELSSANNELQRRFINAQRVYEKGKFMFLQHSSEDSNNKVIPELEEMEEMDSIFDIPPALLSEMSTSPDSTPLTLPHNDIAKVQDRTPLSTPLSTPRSRSSTMESDVFVRLTVKSNPSGYTGVSKQKVNTLVEDNAYLKCVHTFTGHDGFISSVAANDSNVLLTASHDMVHIVVHLTQLENQTMGFQHNTRAI